MKGAVCLGIVRAEESLHPYVSLPLKSVAFPEPVIDRQGGFPGPNQGKDAGRAGKLWLVQRHAESTRKIPSHSGFHSLLADKWQCHL